MLLTEFFGRAVKVGNKLDQKEKDRDEENLDLFYYILDHDKLHKDYFFPLAKKIKKMHKNGKLAKEKITMEFMPMVNKGCLEYYNHKKLDGKPEKHFSKTLREALCEKLYDHYYEDIIKDNYKLGI